LQYAQLIAQAGWSEHGAGKGEMNAWWCMQRREEKQAENEEKAG